MPSAKQIKARKLFAKRVKRGDFKKAIAKSKKTKSSKPKLKRTDANPHQDAHVASYDEAWKGERDYFYRPIRTKGSEKTRAKLKKRRK